MDSFLRLINKATENGCRVQVRFYPMECTDEWCARYYPEDESDQHYLAYGSSLESVSRQILDELNGSMNDE